MPIAVSEEQLALQASIREWAKQAGTIALVRRLDPDPPPGGPRGRPPSGAGGWQPGGARDWQPGGHADLPAAKELLPASLRINELLNWQVAVAATVDIADASVTKVYSSERLQQLGQLLEEMVGCHGDPADEETAELSRWLDIQAKRNTVLTFGGGVNEIQRELIAAAGLGLPRVPRS